MSSYDSATWSRKLGAPWRGKPATLKALRQEVRRAAAAGGMARCPDPRLLRIARLLGELERRGLGHRAVEVIASGGAR